VSGGISTAGLRLEQAPPLLIPIGFFLTAPFGLMVAGALITLGGSALLTTRFAGTTAALVHLGTLGFFAMVMLGALYQMIPVVAGAPVPAVRSAHGVHGGLVVGLGALTVGLWTSSRAALTVGAALLGASFLTFIVLVGVALARAPTRSPTVIGMRVAVAGLAVLSVLGVTMAMLRGAGSPAPGYPGWMSAHIAIGFLVWIGGLVTSVSYQVVPMFYLTPAFPSWAQRAIVGGVAATLLLVTAAVLLRAEQQWIAVAAAPAMVAVFLLHPFVILRAISQRRRRRVDPSLWFWRAGLVAGFAAAPAGVIAVVVDDFRFPLLFGWLVLFGWGGLVIHGMLTRIVPFLVWFHRFSVRVGKQRVPAMRELLPDRYAKLGFGLHLATLLLGVVGIATGWDLVTRALGIGIALTGLALLASIGRALSAGRA
jgi:hypothetical protein